MTDQQAASSSVNLFGHGQGGEAERDLHDDAASSSVDVVRWIMQHVNDLPPWAYSYTERPVDLVEVRAEELEDILKAALERAQQEIAERDKEIERLKSRNDFLERQRHGA